MYACFEMNGFTTKKKRGCKVYLSLRLTTQQQSKIVSRCCFVAYVYRLWNDHFCSVYFKTSLKQAPALRIHPPRSSCLLPDSWRFGEYRDFSPVLQSLRGDHGYRLTYSSPRSSYTRWGSQKCC